jgi:hypothetical protein
MKHHHKASSSVQSIESPSHHTVSLVEERKKRERRERESRELKNEYNG